MELCTSFFSLNFFGWATQKVFNNIRSTNRIFVPWFFAKKILPNLLRGTNITYINFTIFQQMLALGKRCVSFYSTSSSGGGLNSNQQFILSVLQWNSIPKVNSISAPAFENDMSSQVKLCSRFAITQSLPKSIE